MGQDLSHVNNYELTRYVAVIDRQRRILEVQNGDGDGEPCAILGAFLYATHKKLRDQSLCFDFMASLDIERFARRVNVSKLDKKYRDFLVMYKTNLSKLSSQGWAHGKLTMIHRDGRVFYSGYMKRYGVCIHRHFQHIPGSDQLWLIENVTLQSSHQVERILEASPPHRRYAVPRPSMQWNGEWGILEDEDKIDAEEGKWKVPKDERRSSLVAMQRRNLRGLGSLDRDIRQGVYAQLLDHHRWTIDCRANTPKRHMFTTATDTNYCGAALLTDTTIRREFAQAHVSAAETCTPIILLDNTNLSPLPSLPLLPETIKEAHIVLHLTDSDMQSLQINTNPWDLVLAHIRRSIRGLTSLNVRLFHDTTVPNSGANLDSLLHWRPLAATALSRHELHRHMIPRRDGGEDEYTFVFPVAGRRGRAREHGSVPSASHVFRSSDRLRMLDCAAGKAMGREAEGPLGDTLVLLEREVGVGWTADEGALLAACLGGRGVCEMEVGRVGEVLSGDGCGCEDLLG
ncbi:hypothetical protein BDZ85DRAFT_280804 [Elsinoe ampelina]|uniref:Uncharacterized protein n=1 Tax=Elsinoe ampelina TaxID=302913 RepID=A0A6A6GFA7_9PEZI|nr:hypothetical protein BDZ85DRAFT_280804 [Elsinoe ampelina]